MVYICQHCKGRLDPGEKCDCVLNPEENGQKENKKESPHAGKLMGFQSEKSTYNTFLHYNSEME